MSESYSSLKDLPRVPHAEGVGIQVGVGGNPPDKLYISYGEPVDLAVAAANLKARMRGEKPIIPGGIDDEDERLYNIPTVRSSSKMQVAQRGALSAEDVQRIKNATKDTSPTVQKPLDPHVDSSKEGFITFTSTPESDNTQHGDLPLSADLVKEKIIYRDRVVEKVVEVEKETPATKWLKNRVAVQISTQEMTFNISAISIIKSIHAVTLILPSSNNTMTFIPRTGSRISIHSEVTDTLETVFTGASFDIPELGILGLAFLIKSAADDKQ